MTRRKGGVLCVSLIIESGGVEANRDTWQLKRTSDPGQEKGRRKRGVSSCESRPAGIERSSNERVYFVVESCDIFYVGVYMLSRVIYFMSGCIFCVV